MWELDHKENWAPKNSFFWTVALEKTLGSPLGCKEIKTVPPKGNQSWIYIGRTDAEAETPSRWLPDVKNWLIWKDPDAEKDWRQEEKGMTEDEMVGWHHRLNEHDFESTLGVGDTQGGLACCSPWGCKESERTEWLNWTETFSIFAQTVWLIYMTHPTSCFWGDLQRTQVLCICALKQLKTLTSQVEAELNRFVWGNPCLMPLSSLLLVFLAFTFSGRDALKHGCSVQGERTAHRHVVIPRDLGRKGGLEKSKRLMISIWFVDI